MTDEEPVLDPERLAALRSLDGDDEPDVSIEVTRLFLTSTAEGIDEIEAALRDDDAAALRAVAHRVKGSCGNVGATRLEAICRDLELAAHEGHVPTDAAAGLRAEWDRVRAALEAEFGI
jgi:HPt (histidine-containing phosphotransfer) domain-containing protein